MDILQSTQPQSIREKFQIELRKINIHDNQCSTYRMSLRVDSPAWFKHYVVHRDDLENLEELYDCCSKYYDDVKRETIVHQPDIKNEHDLGRLDFNSSLDHWCRTEQYGKKCDNKRCHENSQIYHYRWCPNENYLGDGRCQKRPCDNGRHFLEFKRDTSMVYQCQYESTSLKGKKEICRFHADPNFRIYEGELKDSSEYPFFVVTARSDAIPVITLYPIKHCRSEEYVQSSEAWQAVLQTLIYMKGKLGLDKLPLKSIDINFGKWTSQKSQDSTNQALHAHINIVLTHETIKKIGEKNKGEPKNKWLFPSLVGSVLSREYYRFDDAWVLMENMNNYMIPKWIQQDRELKRRIEQLETELEIVKQSEKELQQMKFDLIHHRKEEEVEVEESTHIIDQSDKGKGINDTIIMSEYQSYNSPKWDRYLYPWNRF